ncbi:Ger(x)C family spore germination protein [Paenibacillus sp. 1001270B_150601_E10]|uniref:Ger(x)C family spore germination protein n=1 Tax=Paenibacillus sp. 1001270B_150601_E10 TaxID=2787079 RepID=UPI002B4C2121|nr:Ger(x)C family spore germination protein [Paenibacillus sp. 1001270B_150601_E10]
MNRKKRRASIPLILGMLAMLLLLSGCWSRKEIEELGITIGTGVDIVEKSEDEQTFEQKGGNFSKQDMLTLTYQVIRPGQSSGVSGGAERKYSNLSVTGDSLYELTRELALISGRTIYGQHYKVIVISDKVARQISMHHLFNFFIREQGFRPSCLVLISKGEARKTFDSKDKSEFPSMKLLSLTENRYRSSRILPPVSLATMLPEINTASSFLLQNVITVDNEVKLAGASVIYGKTGKLIGFINEEELETVNWLTAQIKGGIVKSYDQETGEPLVYEITKIKNRIRPHLEGNRVSFDIEIESDGRLGEYWGKGNDFDNPFIRHVEKETVKEVERRIERLLHKAQKEYRADILGLNEYVKIHYPRKWEKMKLDWDDRFAEAAIRYSVNVTVKEFGTTSI